MCLLRFAIILLAWHSSLIAAPSPKDSLVARLSAIPYFSTEYAFAQHQLAAHYLGMNTVRSRQKAENHIRQAIAREPGRIEHHVLLMKIQYERGFYWAARETSEQILRMSPVPNTPYNESVAEAHYVQGLMAERSALKYRDMVSLSDNNVIYLTSYGHEDLLQAADCFERSIQFKNDHRGALVHLGQLYLEIQGYERMKNLFERAIRLDPNDTEAHCFTAMAYYHLGRSDLAMQFYSRALQLMTREERDVYNSIEHLLPNSERDEWVSLHAIDRAAFQQQFWKTHDPLYLTSVNERLLEHYNRVTYANLRYTVPSKGIPGWRTEKGRIFIRYGKPVVSYKVQPDERILGGSENWQYDDFFFHFTDDFASGHYLLDDQSLLRERSVFNERTESYSFPSDFHFPLLAKAFQFKGTSGETRLRVYYGANVDDIDPDYRTFGLDVIGDIGLFVTNDSGQISGEKRSTVRLNDQCEEEDRFVDFIELDRLPPTNPIREYSIELLTRMDRKAGVVREPIVLRSYSKDELAISDVVIASRITTERDLRVVPTFSSVVSRKSLVYLYFEIYHLSVNDYGNNAFRIETSFTRTDASPVWEKLRFWKSKPKTISSAFDVAGKRRDEKYYFALDVQDLETGQYNLTVQVTDQRTAKSVREVIPIAIEP